MVKLITLPDEIILEIMGFVITLKNVCDYLVLNRDFEKFLRDKCEDFLYAYATMKKVNLYRDIDTDDDSYGIRKYVCLHTINSTIYRNIYYIVICEKSMIDCPLYDTWIMYHTKENWDEYQKYISRFYTTFVLHEQKLKRCRVILGCNGDVDDYYSSTLLHIDYKHYDKYFSKEIYKLSEIKFDMFYDEPTSSINLKTDKMDKMYNFKHLNRHITDMDDLLFFGKFRPTRHHIALLNKTDDQQLETLSEYYGHYIDIIYNHKEKAEIICKERGFMKYYI